jgi:hypothetical protein
VTLPFRAPQREARETRFFAVGDTSADGAGEDQRTSTVAFADNEPTVSA